LQNNGFCGTLGVYLIQAPVNYGNNRYVRKGRIGVLNAFIEDDDGLIHKVIHRKTGF